MIGSINHNVLRNRVKSQLFTARNREWLCVVDRFRMCNSQFLSILPNKNNEIFFKSYIHNFVPLFKFRAPFHLICSLFQIELFLFSCSTWTDTWWTSRLNKIWRSKCLPCSGIWHEIFFVIFYKFIQFFVCW